MCLDLICFIIYIFSKRDVSFWSVFFMFSVCARGKNDLHPFYFCVCVCVCVFVCVMGFAGDLSTSWSCDSFLCPVWWSEAKRSRSPVNFFCKEQSFPLIQLHCTHQPVMCNVFPFMLLIGERFNLIASCANSHSASTTEKFSMAGVNKT